MIQQDNGYGGGGNQQIMSNEYVQEDFLIDRDTQPVASMENNASLYDNETTNILSTEEFASVAVAAINNLQSHTSNSTEDLMSFNPALFNINELLNHEHNSNTQNERNLQEGDHLPNLDENDNFGLNFELNLNPHITGSKNWYYSNLLSKVFIKLDTSFYIDVLYKNDITIMPKYIRCMMVYSDAVGEKVARCNNHLAADKAKNDIEKFSVVRSDNQNIRYTGNIEGKNIKDRLSVLIPLNYIQPNEHNMVTHKIALKFVCQNSCIGRRQTAVIFTLENELNQCLAKKIVNVKVCSCPKRDKSKDEEKFSQLKRTADGELIDAPPGKRVCKVMKVKQELPSEDESHQEKTKINITANLSNVRSSDRSTFRANQNGTFDLQITNIPNIELGEKILKSIFDCTAGALVLDPLNSHHYSPFLKELKKNIEKLCMSRNFQQN